MFCLVFSHRSCLSTIKGGNIRFREAIECSIERYIDAGTKEERAAVVLSVIDCITSVGGKFLRKDFHGNRVRAWITWILVLSADTLCADLFSIS